jgi:hypothetical protein
MAYPVAVRRGCSLTLGGGPAPEVDAWLREETSGTFIVRRSPGDGVPLIIYFSEANDAFLFKLRFG